MTPYPNSFPFEAVDNLVKRLRSQEVDNALAARSAYEVLGYGLGIVLPWPPRAVASRSVVEESAAHHKGLTDAELADALERHSLQASAVARGSRAVDPNLIPWDVVVGLLSQVLLNWLKSRS